MKHQTIRMVFAMTILITFYFAAAAQIKPTTKPRSYNLDTKQSKILWKGPKSVGNKHYGYLQLVFGVLNEDVNGKFKSAEFLLDMQSIRSTDYKEAKKRKEVDDLLMSNDFFAVAHYPTGAMKVKSITATSQADKYKIVGELSLKGVKKVIEFFAIIKKVNQQVIVQGNLTIDRHVWGIDSKKKDETSIFPDFRDKLIADEIPVSLSLIFNKI